MKPTIAHVMPICFILLWSALAFGKGQPAHDGPKTAADVKQFPSKSVKGAKIKPGPFRVKNVTFKEMTINNQKRLVVAVIFNRNVNASTVKPNINIRLLRKNEQHFWVDASTQNNKVNIRPNFVTWVSGAPLEPGIYIMHLRGTIKSADGIYLDCNGDGKGEGGSLPAYESKMYQVAAERLIPFDKEQMEELKDRIKK
ncbi:MAG: hypothetical protein PVH87_12460 [Desulfobacteraceae bacterium]|jgi:hypothetical protein